MFLFYLFILYFSCTVLFVSKLMKYSVFCITECYLRLSLSHLILYAIWLWLERRLLCLHAHVQFCRSVNAETPPALSDTAIVNRTLIPLFAAQGTLDAYFLVYCIGEINQMYGRGRIP